MPRFLLILLLFMTCPPVLQCGDDRLGHFGTKTTYANIKYNPKLEKLSIPWMKENIPDSLMPVHLDSILRHGTRFPDKDKVSPWEKLAQKFQQLVASSNSSLISDNLKKAVQGWENKFPIDSSNALTAVGWKEHVRLAFKYFSMLPSLFKKHYGEPSFNVSSSNKSRCLTSARAFVTGVQFAIRHKDPDENHPDLTFTESLRLPSSIGNVTVHVDDENMRFFNHCEKYQAQVKNNDTAFSEYRKFLSTAKFADTLNHLKGNKKFMDAFEIYDIFQLCAFETAAFGQSVWCRLFSNEDFKVLEYASDLHHHFKTGSAYVVNYEQACVLLKSILSNIESGQLVSLRFGHAETLIPLLLLIGFYGEDPPMNSSNFVLQQNRLFFTGSISPFAGNLAIVLYSSDQSKSYPSALYISFIVNEKIMKVPGFDCYFCDFDKTSKLLKSLKEKVKNCDKVCHLRHLRDEL